MLMMRVIVVLVCLAIVRFFFLILSGHRVDFNKISLDKKQTFFAEVKVKERGKLF